MSAKFIPCDYCDDPAVAFATCGPRGSRVFRCRTCKDMGRTSSPIMDNRSRFEHVELDTLVEAQREAFKRLRLRRCDGKPYGHKPEVPKR